MTETRQNRHFRPEDWALGTGRKPSPYAVSGLDNDVTRSPFDSRLPMSVK